MYISLSHYFYRSFAAATNVVTDRISRDEKLLGSLFSEISYMATRSAKIRDNGMNV